jgi:pimeloyl-ACP methyl ester carboxylesterase
MVDPLRTDTKNPAPGRAGSRPRWRRYLLGVVGLIAAMLPVHYASANRETTTVEAARPAHRLVEGEGFIPLGAGITHYRLDGPADGPVVLLVHGYMDTLHDWDAVVPGLTAAGFRVLRFDVYGTGLSARPPGPYTRELLRGQILDLIDRLRVARADVVGHSLGGAVSVDFTAAHPERVDRLALLAPAVHVDLPQLTFVRLPVVGRYLARTYFVPDVAARLGLRASRGEAWAGEAVEHLKYRGTEAGFLSIIQGDGFSNYIPECRKVAASARPVLLLWGSHDGLVARSAIDEARAAMPAAEYHELSGAPHELPMDRPGQVVPLLVRFLRGGGEPS